MSRPLPPHGTPARYYGTRTRPGCRCTPCRTTGARENKKRALERLAGNPRDVPAGPVIAHIKKLHERMSYAQMEHASGVGRETIKKIAATGVRTVRRENARRILAVPLDAPLEGGYIAALGSTRRLRALYALGHHVHVIAHETGLARTTIHGFTTGSWTRIQPRHAAAIRAAYDRLSMSLGTSWQTWKTAQENNWAPPLAWDDETIDDPAARPRRGKARAQCDIDEVAVLRALRGEPVPLNSRERTRAVEVGLLRGMGYDDVSDALRMDRDTVKRSWERIKERRRAAGLPVPTLRVDEIRDAA